ncbi:MAG TPA: hypothetical protein VNT50_07580 [Microbacterium sp.]|uniref:hypothetical protein n=1 Tax=Microbacterium sp. TaxID=51671 RepID=UPI002BA6AF08|nr:hypothetical protein [Microbacterium sp.]HWI31336.1 hypothetical protein [Microbacterium sp.]
MTFKGVMSALGRRWYIVLVGLLMTAALGYGVINISPPNYTARGLVLLLPPLDPNVETPAGENPLLSLSGLDLPARVVVASFSSNAAQERIAKLHPDAEVSVEMEESTRGPIISIDVTDSSPKGTIATLDYVAGSVATSLQSLQDEIGVPAEAIVNSKPLTMDTLAEADYGDLVRLLILAAGAGLVVTVLAAYVLDGIMARTVRRGRGRGRRGGNDFDLSDDFPTTEAPQIARRVFPADPMPAAPARRSTSG